MNEIQDFRPADGLVVETDAFDVTVDAGDDKPSQGSLVRSGDDVFRVVGYEGTRRVRCQGIRSHRCQVGQAVRFLGEPAGWPRPTPVLHVKEATWEPNGVPVATRRATFAELRGDIEAREIGWASLDAVAPLPTYGSVLLVQPGTAGRDALVARLGGATISVNATPAQYALRGTHPHDELMALRIAAAWAAKLRDDGNDVVLVAEVPVRQDSIDRRSDLGAPALALGTMLDQWLDGLFSTRTGSVLTICHLDVPTSHQLHPILETLPLGSFDAVWFLDAEWVPDLPRCSSRAADGPRSTEILARLQRLKFLEEQERLGLVDPEDENLESLRQQVASLTAPLS